MELKDISISINKSGDSYSQNEDGSPHEKGNNSQGKLPKKLQKRYWKKQNGTIMECAMNFLKVLNKL